MSGPLSGEVPHETSHRGGETGDRIVEGGAATGRWGGLRFSLEGEETTERLGGQVVRRGADASRIPGLAIPRDMDDREAGIRPPELRVGESQPVIDPRPRRLDPDVRLPDEVEEDVPTLRASHIQPDGQLVPGVLDPRLGDLIGRVVPGHERAQSAGRVRVRRFERRPLDVDDPRSELAEVCRGPRSGDEPGRFEDLQSRERAERRDRRSPRNGRRHRRKAGLASITRGVQHGTSGTKYRTPLERPMTEAPWVRFEGEKFRDELTKYKMANHPFATHPFFARLERGEVPKPVVQAWVKQFYPWLASVPIAMAERFANCSWEPQNDRYRRMILDQLVEEAGDPKGKEAGHPELWLRFCEGLGVPRKEVQTTPLLPTTMLAIDDFLYTNRTQTFYVSAAGSSEPPNVPLCARLLPAFQKHYGVDDAHLEYYKLHVTADVEHSEWIGQIVAGFASTPEIRRLMWDQMLRGFALHALLVDGVLAASGGPNKTK